MDIKKIVEKKLNVKLLFQLKIDLRKVVKRMFI